MATAVLRLTEKNKDMAKSYDEILATVEGVRTEVLPEANTAARVGGAIKDVAEYAHERAEENKKKTETLSKEAVKSVTVRAIDTSHTQAEIEAMLISGNYDPNTLYLTFEDEEAT